MYAHGGTLPPLSIAHGGQPNLQSQLNGVAESFKPSVKRAGHMLTFRVTLSNVPGATSIHFPATPYLIWMADSKHSDECCLVSTLDGCFCKGRVTRHVTTRNLRLPRSIRRANLDRQGGSRYENPY